MTAHSPGPWSWDDNVDAPADSPEWHETGRLVDATGVTILCSEADSGDSSWISVLQADAELIRSAPEMLALLRDIEWSDHPADGTKRPSCPDCGALRQSGHDRICKLGSLLARVDGAAKG